MFASENNTVNAAFQNVFYKQKRKEILIMSIQ